MYTLDTPLQPDKLSKLIRKEEICRLLKECVVQLAHGRLQLLLLIEPPFLL